MTSISQSMSTLASGNFRREIISSISQRLNAAAEEATTGKKADIHKALGLRANESYAVHGQMVRNEGYLLSNKLLSGKMETMAASLGSARATLQGFMEVAIANSGTDGPTMSQIQQAARSAYDQLVSQLNAPYQGAQLFGGIDSAGSALQGWDEVNPGTGLSPADVMAGITGGALTGTADAAAKAGDVALVFSGGAANPATNFEATFYNGAPALQSPGVPNPRLQAHIDDRTTLTYGMQANDPAFTEALKGLAMIASLDPATAADSATYGVWLDTAMTAIGAGLDGIKDGEARLGSQQKQLEQAIEGQDARADLFARHINSLEGVDAYEAASRMSELSNQLESAYAINARLARLTFLNFM